MKVYLSENIYFESIKTKPDRNFIRTLVEKVRSKLRETNRRVTNLVKLREIPDKESRKYFEQIAQNNVIDLHKALDHRSYSYDWVLL